MEMKKLLPAVGLLGSFVFVGCSEDSVGSSEKSEVVSEKTEVATIYDLGTCTKSREGVEIYVSKKNDFYVCESGEWDVLGADEEEVLESSSSEKEVSSSSKRSSFLDEDDLEDENESNESSSENVSSSSRPADENGSSGESSDPEEKPVDDDEKPEDESSSSVSSSVTTSESSSSGTLIESSSDEMLNESSSSDVDENLGEESSSSESFGISSAEISMEPVRKSIENTFPNNEAIAVDNMDAYYYYGAELTGKDQFIYGRFEARMKMVSISGSVSSMFLYYDQSYLLGDEPWNEIDIEVLGTNPGAWQANLITREPDDHETPKKGRKVTSETKTGFGFDATADFHLYTIIWTPEYISWEIDSVEIRRDVVGMETRLTHDQVAFMNLEQSLRFNLWSSKSAAWVGKFTGAELADGPQEQVIDYVRAYRYDVATKTFTLDWQDDFEGDALDRSRWSAGNWEMENVTLSADNVVVEGGYCKLRMTRELNE